jgi:hypothetical protein
MIEIVLDDSPFKETMLELQSLGEILPEIVNALLDNLLDFNGDIVRLEAESTITRAEELRIPLHPSERLRELLATVRARKVDSGISVGLELPAHN